MINTICYKKSQLYQEIWGISDEYYVDYPASNKKKQRLFYIQHIMPLKLKVSIQPLIATIKCSITI